MSFSVSGCSMGSVTGHSRGCGSLLSCKFTVDYKLHSIILLIDFLYHFRCIAPFVGTGMIFWWIVDNIRDHPGSWWQFDTQSLAMIISQVQQSASCLVIGLLDRLILSPPHAVGTRHFNPNWSELVDEAIERFSTQEPSLEEAPWTPHYILH